MNERYLHPGGCAGRDVGDSSTARIAASIDLDSPACQSAIITGKMKDELCSKIQAILDRKIRKEMQVVYLLVEARKLMGPRKLHRSCTSNIQQLGGSHQPRKQG